MPEQNYGETPDLADRLALVANMSPHKAAGLVDRFTAPELGRLTPNELRAAGCTRRQARAIVAAFALSRSAVADCYGQRLTRPADAAAYLMRRIGREDRENFAMVLLDSRVRVIECHIAAVGSLAQVSVHPRDVFRPAVRAGAAYILIAHNHPSGDPTPSEADITLTQRMVDTGEAVGIPVVDHLVITSADFVSIGALGLGGLARPK